FNINGCPRLKPILWARPFRWTKVQLPPAKAEGSTERQRRIPTQRRQRIHAEPATANSRGFSPAYEKNFSAPEKSFRAERLHHVDARSACRRQHRGDYRRA